MIYRFGNCILDEERYELCRAGTVVAIEPRVFQVLLYLIQHQDCVVTRDELLEHCWPDTFVSESALTRCLARVRKAVGDHRGGPPLIKTVHGQGYRFVAPLLAASSQLPPPSEAHQAPLDIHTPQVGPPSPNTASSPYYTLSSSTGRVSPTTSMLKSYMQLYRPLTLHARRSSTALRGISRII
jgi:DNA-binding winged helix-turn-helix (wHTH) protein